VPLIRITDSEIDFMDESLPIHFRTVIGEIEGDIKDVSSNEATKTTVNIKGSVDGYAPVKLAGTAQPLRSPPAIDLDLTFAGVDMALLSPYSGTYAGYAIERGVLNLDLKYAMEENQLKGNNKIVIDQMKLGEKVESEKSLDLPLELALALLTDSNGVIDMEIPVSGNVDDPEFSVGSVVLGAFMNLLTKVVTSPFTLLASLVDSEEDLQRLNFKSGSAALQASTREKLDNLSKAMSQRPELGLAITGRLQLEADRERLQKNLLQAELLADGLPEAELSSKGPAWETAIAARYQAVAPGETTLTASEQYRQLAQGMPLSDADLLELASARAIAVKSYLVNEAGLDPDRAAISKPDLDAAENLYSGAELEIEI
jgi:outer membrane protein OmpA-like peptidoglycan-associated protein